MVELRTCTDGLWTNSANYLPSGPLLAQHRTLPHETIGTYGTKSPRSLANVKMRSDPCPAPPRVRPDLQAQEDRPASIRWLTMR